MDGSQLKSSEIGQLVAGLCVIAAFLIWLVATVLTGIISFFSPDWGCYACGWRGRRRHIYRPDALKMNFSGLPSFLIVHTIGPFIMLAGVVLRLRSTLNCPECGSINVRPLTQTAPPLPPPRKSLKARAFLKQKREGVDTQKLASSLVKCNACQAVVALNPLNLALACPHCGSQPFIYSNA
ncbi:hypothetical protein PLCT1_02749 [Planctomycetaceae bacterium]|nr:hypothetical protein PLCT1_02749 [Planctomycetaceae bacterium]